MVRNRNGYWMDRRFLLHPDPDGNLGGGEPAGAGGGTGAPAGDNPAGDNPAGGAQAAEAQKADGTKPSADTIESLQARIKQLEADAVKRNAALDKATHEASESKKALQAKMTQEELDAEAKKEAEEKQAKELDDLRKAVAKGETVKSIMGTLGFSEENAGVLADCMYGAADVKNALLLFQKAWKDREKALKLEYGKVTPPGAGADSNSPEAQAINRAKELGKARSAQNEQAQKAINAYIR